MKRQQIIAIAVVLLLAAGIGAGYQFYFRPTLEKFAEDQKYLEAINAKLQSLKKTFPGGRPEAAVELVKAKIQPWHDTLEQRARQFTIRDFKDLEPFPKTDVLKAYYEQAAQKMVTDLATELAIKGVYYNPIILNGYFGMAQPGSLTGKTVNDLQVHYWLSTIKFGTSIVRMLVDSDMLMLDNMLLWVPRTSADGFESYAIGVSMWMTMEQFCKFLEKLHNDETMCIKVNGFRIVNNSLRAYYDPPLQIELVFQIDQYKYEPTPVKIAGAAGAPGGAGATGADAAMEQLRNRRAGAQTTQQKKSWWSQWLPF